MTEMKFTFLTRTVDVRIGEGLAQRVEDWFGDGARPNRMMLLFDEHVHELHGAKVMDSVRRTGIEPLPWLVPEGEAAKTIDVAAKVFDHLARLRWSRDEWIAGIGGGATSDLAAFVSGLWKRGTRLILVATTLEGQIDAAVGGKCGVNHAAGKNLVGTFYHADRVIMDGQFLATLSDRDFRSGLAESLKHGFIADPAFVEWQCARRRGILGREGNVLEELVARNVQIKGRIVEGDEFELGEQRQILNFGHTVGHGLETVLANRYRHGECVSVGMTAALRLSVKLNLLPQAEADGAVQVLSEFGLPIVLPEPTDPAEIMRAMRQDKKIRGSQMRFVLLGAMGRPVVRADVAEADVMACLHELNAR